MNVRAHLGVVVGTPKIVGEELLANFRPKALSALRANELVDVIDLKATLLLTSKLESGSSKVNE